MVSFLNWVFARLSTSTNEQKYSFASHILEQRSDCPQYNDDVDDDNGDDEQEDDDNK